MRAFSNQRSNREDENTVFSIDLIIYKMSILMIKSSFVSMPQCHNN